MSRSRSSAPHRWHRFLEHTGEVRLQVGAESLAGLLAEAGRALGLLLLGSREVGAPAAVRTIEVRSLDRGALLVDWLNEILFLAETELWVPVTIEVDAGEDWLRASARGVPVTEAPSLVKAATHHGLRVRGDADAFEAEVVLDV
jgi:SHS2 domain-containing protein